MKKRAVRALWWTLCAAWLAVIFGHSLMPAELSKAESGGLLAWLHAAIPFLTERALRKLAHFSEFAVLGVLLARSLPAMPLGSALVSLLCALTDETIQLYVPGRSGQVSDVWIDFAGALCAIIVSELLLLCIRRARAKPSA